MWTLNNVEVGKRLKTIRELKDLSSRKFATRAKIDPSQYAKIESGALPITEKIMEKLKTTFGLNQNYILYGTNIPDEGGNIEDNYSNKSTVADAGADNIYATNKKADKIIEDLAASSRDHAAADLKRAEAEILREQNHKRIIDHITASGGEEIPLVAGTISGELRELLIDLGLGKNWSSREEGAAAVRSALYGKLPKKKVRGIRNS